MTICETEIFDNFSAQLGEIAWHTFTIDKSVDQVSQNHFKQLKPYLKKYRPKRFLELACYFHYTANLINGHFATDTYLCDISPHSLVGGKKASTNAGIAANSKLIASDFHDIPFEDESFDFVYISSAVHHTRTPEVVLQECLRVLCDGGILYINNEPCEREFAFHKFRTNRRANFTDFEKYIDSQGLLRTITSYLFQARPEELFGMVENDQISLDTYLSCVSSHKLLELKLDWRTHLSALDELILNSDLRFSELANLINSELNSRLSNAIIKRNEELMGMSLPTPAEIDSMSQRVAESITKLPRKGLERDKALTRLFGGILQMTVRKNGKSSKLAELKQYKKLPMEDDVHIKPLRGMGYEVMIDRPLLPHIPNNESDKLAKIFPPTEWSTQTSDLGTHAALIPKCSEPNIHLLAPANSILLIRMFTPCPNEAYKIVFLANGSPLEEMVVANAESRLLRKLLIDPLDKITLRFVDLQNSQLPQPKMIRIPVMQLIPVQPGSTSEP